MDVEKLINYFNSLWSGAITPTVKNAILKSKENADRIEKAINDKEIVRDFTLNNPEDISDPIVEAQNATTEAVKALGADKHDGVVKVSLEGISVVAVKGELGDPGYTPIKGKDYFDGKDGLTPIKFKDYFTKDEIEKIIQKIQKSIRIPKDGDDGVSPVAGVDYPSYEQIEKQIKELVALFPIPKNGKIPNHEWNEDKTKVRFETPNGEWGEWSETLKGNSGRPIGYGRGLKNFYELLDVPSSYVGQSGKIVKVNSAETGLEFVTPQSIENVNWGEIGGTLTNQTDLNTALGLKLDVTTASSTYELLSNKQTDLTASATKYPTVNAVNTGLALKATLAGTAGGQTLIGGTAVTDVLKLQGTSGNGTLTSPAIQALVGNNGGTVALTVLNNGNVGIGTTTPTSQLTQKSTAVLESAALGAELAASNWTTTDWTGDFATGFDHNTGNTTALTNTLAAVTNNLYQISYTVTGRTAGSFTIGFGGATKASITATGAWGPKATSTGTFSITPTTDFDGTIVISVKQITGTYSATYAIQDSAGNNAFEIRNTLATLNNSFIGLGAGRYNTTGYNNSAQGVYALSNNTTGYNNSAQGEYTLYNNTTGYQNSVQGVQALYNNTTGYSNSAQGFSSLYTNTTGYYNSAQGFNSLYANTTGYNNSAQGVYALSNNTTGYSNSAQGHSALRSNTTGYLNSAVGTSAGRYISGGSVANQTSNNSVYLGYNSMALADGDTNEIVIGASAIGVGSNSVVLGNDSITKTILKGNVGIGTTSPGAKLHVSGGNIRLESGNTTQGLLLGTGQYGFIDFNDNSTLNGLRLSSLGDMVFGSNTNAVYGSSSFTEAMRIKNGNVGIGTVSPTNILSLGGNAVRKFWMERGTVANTVGYSLTIQGGGATAAATDKAGGNLILIPGLSTGTGESGVQIQGCPAGSTGTADGTPIDIIKVLGNKLGFYNQTPIARAVLTTGVGHTVDDVITALQNLGLVSQS